MSKIPTLVACCAALAVLAPAARGQSGNNAVDVTFQTAATSSTLPALYYKPTPTPPGNQRPFKIVPNVISPEVYPYTGPAEIDFYAADAKTGTAPARDGAAAPSYHVVGHAVFPKNGEYILYFSSGPNGTVLATPVPRSTTDFPAGTIALVNASGLPIEIKAFDLKNALKTTEIIRVGDVKVIPVGETLTFRLFRMDREPVEEFHHFLAEPNMAARFSLILMADLSLSVLSEDARTPSSAGNQAPTTPTSGGSPPAALNLPAPSLTRTTSPSTSRGR